jgi:hypothetical protein
MLIGDVIYYNAATGHREAGGDSNVGSEYARKASNAKTVARWTNTNGDRATRWFWEGEQIIEAALPEAVRKLWCGWRS